MLLKKIRVVLSIYSHRLYGGGAPMEELKIRFTIKHQSQVIRIDNLNDLKESPIIETLTANLLRLESRIYSEAVTSLLNTQLDKESIKKVKVNIE